MRSVLHKAQFWRSPPFFSRKTDFGALTFGTAIVVISEEAEPLGTKKSKNSFSQKIVKIGNLF